jgi:hypothetical protein
MIEGRDALGHQGKPKKRFWQQDIAGFRAALG